MESQAQKVFSFLDEGKGYIYKSDLPLALRASGMIISEKELKILQDKQPLQITLKDFIRIMSQHNNANEDDLKQAFNRIGANKETCRITSQKLKEILTGAGEPLALQEVDEIVQKLESQGNIDYRVFIKAVIKDMPSQKNFA